MSKATTSGICPETAEMYWSFFAFGTKELYLGEELTRVD